MGMTAVSSWLSLGEGSTPLVHARRISDSLGCELHLKCEGLNPTGSFKDRGMVVAVERAGSHPARHRRRVANKLIDFGATRLLRLGSATPRHHLCRNPRST